MGKLISKLNSYRNLLFWLYREIWATCRKQAVIIVAFDLCSLACMGGGYVLARDILKGESSYSAEFLPLLKGIPPIATAGVSVAFVSASMLLHSFFQLMSRKWALRLMGVFQLCIVDRIWDRLQMKNTVSVGQKKILSETSRFILSYSRTLGVCSRLAMMVSGATLSSFFLVVGAFYFSPSTAIVFSLVGGATLILVHASNRKAAQCSKHFGLKSQSVSAKVVELVRDVPMATGNFSGTGEGLHNMYKSGYGAEANDFDARRIFEIYRAQILMKTGAAIGVCFAVILIFVKMKNQGDMVEVVTLSVFSVMLMRVAFGVMSGAVGFLTRLNLNYPQMTEFQRFLKSGRIPQVVSAVEHEEI